MFDAVDTGGVGVTTALFRHFGMAGASNTQQAAVASVALLLGSTIGGLLGYGLYGWLRDRRWGSWRAGALVGVVGGMGGLTILHLVGRLTGRRFVG
jgi:hypothetical protein